MAEISIEELLERVNIVEIVSEYVNLKKSGKNYKSLCPFHPEKTPSFFVSEEKQIFHCFGCGIGGNAIRFLMYMERIPFQEALEILAKKVGFEITKNRVSPEENIEKKKILKANEYALNLYKKTLYSPIGRRALEYLYQRNLSDEDIERFSIGYAPSNNYLLNKINEEKLDKEDFVQASLLDENGLEDVFKNRIIFPIYNIKNEIIGFGGRTLDDEVMPKYLNIRENIVFNKSSCLFGINWAKEKIKESGYVIFVEGYFDVLKMQMSGYINTVAPMGTSISELHLRILKKLTDKVLLIFDGDDAGIRGCLRNLESILRNGFVAKICMLPAGFDPDKFIDEYGISSLSRFIEKSEDFLDFSFSVYSQLYDIKNPREKSTVIRDILKLIVNIPDEIERYEYLKRVAEKMDIKMEFLESILEDIKEKRFYESYNTTKVNFNNSSVHEKLLLEIALNDKKYWEKLVENKNRLTEKMEKIIENSKKLIEKNIKITPSLLIGFCEDEEISSFISSIAVKDEIEISEEKKEKIFKDCLKNVYRKKLLSEIEKWKKVVSQKIEKGENYKEELNKIQELLFELKREG